MKDKTTTEQPTDQDEKVWLKAKQEFEIVGKIIDVLRPFTQNERRRILAYVQDKIWNP